MKIVLFAVFLLIVVTGCSNSRSHLPSAESFVVQAQKDTVRFGENYKLKIYPKELAAVDVIGGQVHGLQTHLPKNGDTLSVEFTPLCQKQVDGVYTEVSEGVVALEMRFTVTYAIDSDTLSTTVRKMCFTDCSQEMVFTQ